MVVKNYVSGFAKTNLQEILEKIGKKKIVLVGMAPPYVFKSYFLE